MGVDFLQMADFERFIKNLTSATIPEGDLNRLDAEGYTPLAYAVKEGNIGVAKALIKAGARIHVSDEIDKDPLIMVMKDENKCSFLPVIVPHADVNRRFKDGSTPIVHALLNASAIDELTSTGSDTNVCLNGQWILHMLCFELAKLPPAQRQQYSVDKLAYMISQLTGSFKCAAVSKDVRNEYGETPLLMLANRNSTSPQAAETTNQVALPSLVRAFLRVEADAGATNGCGRNVWHYLLSGYYYTHSAVELEALMMEVETERLAKHLAAVDAFGAYPADYVAVVGHFRPIRNLLVKFGAPTHYGTPLMTEWLHLYNRIGSGSHSAGVIRDELGSLPLDRQSQLAEATDVFGNSLLACVVACYERWSAAAADGEAHAVVLITRLLELGSDPNARCPPGWGELPLHHWWPGRVPLVSPVGMAINFLLPGILPLLLAAGGDPNQFYDTAEHSPDRKPLLHHVMGSSGDGEACFTMVQALLDAGADVNAVDSDGVSLMMAAATDIGPYADGKDGCRWTQTLQLLIDRCGESSLSAVGPVPNLLQKAISDRYDEAEEEHYLRACPAVFLLRCTKNYRLPKASPIAVAAQRAMESIAETVERQVRERNLDPLGSTVPPLLLPPSSAAGPDTAGSAVPAVSACCGGDGERLAGLLDCLLAHAAHSSPPNRLGERQNWPWYDDGRIEGGFLTFIRPPLLLWQQQTQSGITQALLHRARFHPPPISPPPAANEGSAAVRPILQKPRFYAHVKAAALVACVSSYGWTSIPSLLSEVQTELSSHSSITCTAERKSELFLRVVVPLLVQLFIKDIILPGEQRLALLQFLTIALTSPLLQQPHRQLVAQWVVAGARSADVLNVGLSLGPIRQQQQQQQLPPWLAPSSSSPPLHLALYWCNDFVVRALLSRSVVGAVIDLASPRPFTYLSEDGDMADGTMPPLQALLLGVRRTLACGRQLRHIGGQYVLAERVRRIVGDVASAGCDLDAYTTELSITDPRRQPSPMPLLEGALTTLCSPALYDCPHDLSTARLTMVMSALALAMVRCGARPPEVLQRVPEGGYEARLTKHASSGPLLVVKVKDHCGGSDSRQRTGSRPPTELWLPAEHVKTLTCEANWARRKHAIVLRERLKDL